MGNSFTCFSPIPQKRLVTKSSSWFSPSSNRKSEKQQSRSSSSSSSPTNPEIFDDSYIKQQAQIASMLYQHHLQNNSDILAHLDRSASTNNYPSQYNRKQRNLSRRSRSVSSSNPISSQLFKQDVVGEKGLKKHFVLVHGGGFGAWCWYKNIALLKEANCEVDAIDLAGSGHNFCDINSITTLQQYAKPLTDFLQNIPDDQKVILVGHDIGGACVSYAMELYPSKVSKAIFVAATMLANGQSALHVFSQQLTELNQRAQKFIYANGKTHPPTAIDFDKSLLEDFLFNLTPSKDIALASVSMRQVPFAPAAEKLCLSIERHDSVPRFYIKTDEDFVISVQLQETMIQSNPPKQVFELKGSDHSPFLSRPQALHRLLIEISNL